MRGTILYMEICSAVWNFALQKTARMIPKPCKNCKTAKTCASWRRCWIFDRLQGKVPEGLCHSAVQANFFAIPSWHHPSTVLFFNHQKRWRGKVPLHIRTESLASGVSRDGDRARKNTSELQPEMQKVGCAAGRALQRQRFKGERVRKKWPYAVISAAV